MLGPRGEGREGLVPVLKELGSRGAADLQTNSPEHVLEDHGDGGGGGIWALVTEEKTLALVLRIRTRGICLDETVGKGSWQEGLAGAGPGAFQEQCMAGVVKA